MAITATLVGGQTPKLVQVVISATANGVAWKVTGSAAGTSWTVPGGEGVGDGGALVLVDNRTPLNVPVTYTYTPATGSPQVATPLVVDSIYGTVLMTPDGQSAVGADLLEKSSGLELAPNYALFTVPNRPRPVVRYAMTGDGGGALRVGLEMAATAALRSLTRDGAPLLVRRQPMDDDLPLVFTALFTQFRAPELAIDIAYREWDLPFVFTDDAYMDVRLGAFSWADFNAAFAGDSWTTFNTVMSGRSWAQFNRLDWSTI